MSTNSAFCCAMGTSCVRTRRTAAATFRSAPRSRMMDTNSLRNAAAENVLEPAPHCNARFCCLVFSPSNPGGDTSGKHKPGGGVKPGGGSRPGGGGNGLFVCFDSLALPNFNPGGGEG